MRREYLIDGYNLLCSRPRRRPRGPGNLHKERLALLQYIGNRLEDNALATVVFDASSPLAKSAPRAEPVQFGIHVLFAETYDSADELIQTLCKLHTHPKQLVVVSDDNQVRKAARRRKAKPMSCDAFMAHLAANARLRNRPIPPPEKPQHVTPEERDDLTQAFELPEEPPKDPNDMSDFYRDMNE